MQPGILRMYREDAAQHYPIKRATWGFCQDGRYSIPVLCFAIVTEQQDSIFPEEDGWSHRPMWCLDVWARALTPGVLQPGCEFRIPESCDDFSGVVFTNFYYDEHEGTTDNLITIRDVTDEALDLSIEGYIRHEFASMRPTRITVDARFTRLSPHEGIGVGYFREALPPHEPPYGAIVSQIDAGR
jgi:hypothetical protein